MLNTLSGNRAQQHDGIQPTKASLWIMPPSLCDVYCRMLLAWRHFGLYYVFLVISVFFDYEVLAVSGRYICGHSLLPLAKFYSGQLHCYCVRSVGHVLFCDCFTGAPFDGLAFCYASFILGMCFLIFRRCLCSPSRIFLHVYLFVIVLASFVSVGGSESCLTFVGAYFSLILYAS